MRFKEHESLHSSFVVPERICEIIIAVKARDSIQGKFKRILHEVTARAPFGELAAGKLKEHFNSANSREREGLNSKCCDELASWANIYPSGSQSLYCGLVQLSG